MICKKIVDNFPKYICEYYEPFLGGGSILCELLNRLESKTIKIDNIMVNDLNNNIIEFFLCIKLNVHQLLNELKYIEKKYKLAQNLSKKKDVYYYYRDVFNKKGISMIKKAAIFLFLNKTCFRGLYRESKNGFNVPFGNYKNPLIYDKENLLNLSKLLVKYEVKFTSNDFSCIKIDPNALNFVYLDPPYFPINKKSFTSYNRDNFKDGHQKLNTLCFDLHKNYVKFLHSNSKCTHNLEAYKNFRIEEIECRCRINSKNPAKKQYELIIKNF